jgi:MoxR-like ATPase
MRTPDTGPGPGGEPPRPADAPLDEWRERALELERQVGRAIVGQPAVLRGVTLALFARGHVLLEGDVGVGKTTLLRAFARAVGGEFERVEGTVDLMPGDLVYRTFVDAEGRPRIEPGPLLRHGESLVTFFFNEINRARPQVQALLLRAMAERTVSAFGREFRFPHLTVFADRNRLEREETFELPAAARDRFLFELRMEAPADEAARTALAFDPGFHDPDALIGRIDAGLLPWQELEAVGEAVQRGVRHTAALERYVMDLWDTTVAPQRHGVQIDGVDMPHLMASGASPRGMMMLVRAARVAAWLAGRDHVLPDDVAAVFPATMVHRLFFTPLYELRRAEIADALVAEVLRRVPAPR